MNDKQKYGVFVVIVIMLLLVGIANPIGEVRAQSYHPVTLYGWFDSAGEIIQHMVLIALAGMSWVLLFREEKVK